VVHLRDRHFSAVDTNESLRMYADRGIRGVILHVRQEISYIKTNATSANYSDPLSHRSSTLQYIHIRDDIHPITATLHTELDFSRDDASGQNDRVKGAEGIVGGDGVQAYVDACESQLAAEIAQSLVELLFTGLHKRQM
jgi:hypothetical protein